MRKVFCDYCKGEINGDTVMVKCAHGTVTLPKRFTEDRSGMGMDICYACQLEALAQAIR